MEDKSEARIRILLWLVGPGPQEDAITPEPLRILIRVTVPTNHIIGQPVEGKGMGEITHGSEQRPDV